MALPTVEKTWQISTNNAVPSLQDTDFGRASLCLIKNRLIGFGSSAWTVSGSSNRITSNMAGTDLWLADADLYWAYVGNAHSWIVLRQAGIAPKFEVLFELASGGGMYTPLVIYVSPSAGFGLVNGGTDGTHIVRPTASDEVSLGIKSWGSAGNGVTKSSLWHVTQSTDGQCTRVFATYNNYVLAFWIIDKAKLPVAHWTYPWVVGVVGTENLTGSYGDYAQWTDASNIGTKIDSTITGIRMTTEGPGNGPLGKTMTYTDDNTGEAPLTPVGLLATTAPVRGRKGMLFDMWCGINGSSYNTGPTMYPDDGSRLFTQVNSLVMPWAGALAPQWA
jgi:hypothetical protein